MALPKGQYYGDSAPSLWKFALRWDASWYWGIATQGYHYTEAETSSVAFFPGYPALMGLVNFFLPAQTPPYSGLIISNLSLFLAGACLWRLAANQERDQPDATARADLATALLFFGPVSLFFSILYSESLFLLACLATFLAAQKGRFWLAGACGAWAAFTRNGGVLLVLPLLWEWWHWQGRQQKRRFSWEFFACGMPALGTLAYMAHLYVKFGDPLVFTRTQVHWNRALNWPWVSFSEAKLGGFPAFYQVWFPLAGYVAITAMVVAWWAQLRRSHWLFGALLILLTTSANHLESLPRYLSVVFPLYLLVARRPTSWAGPAWLVVAFSSALLALSTILFVNGFWFT